MAIALFMGITLISNAQESIKAVIKRCEMASSVEMSYIINKDPETRKVQSSLTIVKIKDDPGLVKEFIAAFEKDKDNAYSASGSIKNGVSIPSSYRFSNGKDNYISCTMTISNDNTGASISYRESPNKPNSTAVLLDREYFSGPLMEVISPFETGSRFFETTGSLESLLERNEGALNVLDSIRLKINRAMPENNNTQQVERVVVGTHTQKRR